jgi:aspartate/methionine/tyrosine aminotransferase
VIGPSPAYSTHSSAEAAHAGVDPLMYKLDPENNWYPDLNDLRSKIIDDHSISGILIINPNNPTGTVYPYETMNGIVKIAEEYDLFIVCDEVYSEITYNGKVSTPLSDIVNDVCGISMRGISKELPWPGARCGWIEVYNKDKDPMFEKYIETVVHAKMLEVCSTTLPQKVIPSVLSDPRYKEYHTNRNKQYEVRSKFAYDALREIDGVIVNQTDGAFYMTVAFENGVLNDKQRLELSDNKIKDYIEEITDGVAHDKRFVYYLLGATGICVVPLTGFSCDLYGFRVTLLETDTEKFEWIFTTIAENIKVYLNS